LGLEEAAMRMDYRLDPPESGTCPRCGEYLIDDRCPDGCVQPDLEPDPDLLYDRKVEAELTRNERDFDYLLEDSKS